MVEGGEDVGEEEREVGGGIEGGKWKKGEKEEFEAELWEGEMSGRKKEKYGLEGIIGGEGEIEDVTL